MECLWKFCKDSWSQETFKPFNYFFRVKAVSPLGILLWAVRLHHTGNSLPLVLLEDSETAFPQPCHPSPVVLLFCNYMLSVHRLNPSSELTSKPHTKRHVLRSVPLKCLVYALPGPLKSRSKAWRDGIPAQKTTAAHSQLQR